MDSREQLLKGKILKVYWYLLTHDYAGVREIQTSLDLSSPGIVSYQLNKLMKAGIIAKDEKLEKYYVKEEIKTGILAFYIRFGYYMVPRFSIYLSIFIIAFVIFVISSFIMGDKFILHPASLILFGLGVMRGKKTYLWIAIFIGSILFFYYGATGTRSQLLPLILSLPTFWYLFKNKRPRSLTIIAISLFCLFSLNVVRESRNAMVRSEEDIRDIITKELASPLAGVLRILQSGDTDMFDSLANELLIVPSELAFHYGAIITDILIRAVPRTMWINKPLESNDALVDALWPIHYSKSRASPAFSIIGYLYADSGLLTVVLGMFGVGVLLSALWHWYQCYRCLVSAKIIYSMSLPFVAILMRGTIPDTLSRILFMLVPLLFTMLAMRLRIIARTMDHGLERI